MVYPERLPNQDPSTKLQATSTKHQAASFKQQALGAKHQAVKHQAERQATSVERGPSHQAPSKVFPGDRSTSLGPRHSHKSLMDRGSRV